MVGFKLHSAAGEPSLCNLFVSSVSKEEGLLVLEIGLFQGTRMTGKKAQNMDAAPSTLGPKGTCRQQLTVLCSHFWVGGSDQVMEAGLESLEGQEILPRTLEGEGCCLLLFFFFLSQKEGWGATLLLMKRWERGQAA